VTSLADPIRLGEKLKLKNRLVNAPMYRCFGVEDGYILKQYVDSYAAEARGGPAMIIVANTAVSKNGIAFRRLPRIDDSRFVAGLGDLAYAIHLADCKAAIQLFHGGIICRSDCLGGALPVAPSELPLPFAPDMRSHALTDAEIEQIVDDFGTAAERAMEAGFDAVNIHACHGGLPHQFISPLFNKREDKWGVDKLLFAKRVIKSIREHTDPDYPIIWRFSAEEYCGIEGYDFTFTLEQTVPALIEAGVDCLDVSTGGVTSNEGLAHLTPVKEKEVLILCHSVDHGMKEAIFQVAQAMTKAMGVASFNLALYMPPLAPVEEDWSGFPLIARMVDRGDLANRHSDMGGMELYATSVVASDPLAVARVLKERMGCDQR